ncbi:hypothetical protein [Helicobacter didelphidarum]|uniref:hypothetical protein n=1 Tax=Helicobacter didelphidarum TaxID=2040648 RepID=UPI0015F17EBD|nr:hypothetical protein [Helicobacter didelphidarum]
MKKKLYRVLLGATAVFFFIGCSSLLVKPENIVGYNNGIAIIQEEKPTSKIQFEVAQEEIGGLNESPLLIYIIVENLTDTKISFDTTNIEADLNGKTLYPLSFQELRQSGFNFIQPLSDYGIEIESVKANVHDPYFSISAYRPFYYPLFFDRGFMFGYGFYDYSFSRANMLAQQQTEDKARKTLVGHYLRKNTLKKNSAKSGFIVFPYSQLSTGEFILKVQVKDEKHELKLQLVDTKAKKK